MTGIAAIFAAGPACPRRLQGMMAAMAERAKDGMDIWLNGSFGLGAAILHTTAESLEADQPHTNEDASLALVMDGYLTNWEELRRDLAARGAVLRNASDAELVLRAYEQWGEDCADRIHGEFAFVIADRRAHHIFAARDHQGLRPLYFYKDGDTLLFASDLAAIIAGAERKPEPNLDYLANFVSGHWYLRDATVWKGVERVPQAHWLAFDGVRLTVRRYYDLPSEVTLRYRREQDYVEHYRDVLFDSVRRTSRSHRPLAIAVSGGLDSSSIFCVAHFLEQQGRLLAPGLQGYSLAGDVGTLAYELPYARAAADHCGRSLVEAPLFRPEIDWFTAQARHDCDVPIPQNGAMSRILEEAASSAGAKTLLNGHGGDQWLDGTKEYYTEFASSFDIAGFAAAFARDAKGEGWRKTLPTALRFAVSAFVPDTLRRGVRRRRRHRRYRDQGVLYWMLPAWRQRLLVFEEQFYADLPHERHALGNWNRLYSPYHAFALDIMQRQRAKAGLETREPMQTRQFIEFCAASPKWIFNQAGLTKVVHRKAMRGILPDMIVDRTTKAAFAAPALSLAFARYAFEHADGMLCQLCDRDGLRKLTDAENFLCVDPELNWEIWGAYAVAGLKVHG